HPPAPTTPPPPPYTTLFRSVKQCPTTAIAEDEADACCFRKSTYAAASRSRASGVSGPVSSRNRFIVRSSPGTNGKSKTGGRAVRSEEHTSELQSRVDIVCSL